jgi:hypothetical protein
VTTAADPVDGGEDRGATAETGDDATEPAAATVKQTGAPGPVERDLGDAVERDARDFGWPVVVAVLVGLFLFFQGQVDRHEPKLADAPLDQGERLRFRS